MDSAGALVASPALQVSEEWRAPLAALLQSARRAAQFGLLQLTVPALPETHMNGHGSNARSGPALGDRTPEQGTKTGVHSRQCATAPFCAVFTAHTDTQWTLYMQGGHRKAMQRMAGCQSHC